MGPLPRGERHRRVRAPGITWDDMHLTWLNSDKNKKNKKKMKKRDRVASHDYDTGERTWTFPMLELGDKVQHGVDITEWDVRDALDRSSVWRDLVDRVVNQEVGVVIQELNHLEGYLGPVTESEALGLSMSVITERVLETFFLNKKGDYETTMRYFLEYQERAVAAIMKKFGPPPVYDLTDSPRPRVTTTTKEPSTPKLPGAWGSRAVPTLDLNAADPKQTTTQKEQTTTQRWIPVKRDKNKPSERSPWPRPRQEDKGPGLSSARPRANSDDTEINNEKPWGPANVTCCLKCGKYKAVT